MGKSSQELLKELQSVKDAQMNTELLLAGILKVTTEAIIIVDEKQRILLFNKGAENLFGYEADEILGQTLSQIVRQRFRAPNLEHFGQFLETSDENGKVFAHIQISAHHKSGQVIAAEAAVAKIERDGQKLLSILVYELKPKAEFPEHMHEQERLFRLYNELSTDYVFSVGFTDEGKPYYTWIAAEGFERVTGFTLNELEDANQIYHPEDRPRADADRALSYQGIPTESEYRFFTKSGELRWLQIRRFAEMDEQTGRVLYMHGVVKDITERKLNEQQRLELLSEQARVQSMTKFITGTSHDLMTSLSIIKTNVYLLQKMQDEGRRMVKLASIENQTQRLQEIIQDMLTLLRLDSIDTKEMSRELIKLGEFLHEMLPAFQRRANEKQQRLSLSVQDEGLVFQANTNWLNIALTKLIENALHYTPNAGEIRIFAARVGRFMQIGVDDTGIGIAKEDLEHIFERFYRAEEARPSDQGTGLGLSIVKAVMDLHGGHVLTHSVVGKGSTFILCFPLD